MNVSITRSSPLHALPTFRPFGERSSCPGLSWWLSWWSVVRAREGVVSIPRQGTYWVAGWVRKHTGGNRSMLLARSLSPPSLSEINKHPLVRKINNQKLSPARGLRTCCSLCWDVLSTSPLPLILYVCSFPTLFRRAAGVIGLRRQPLRNLSSSY